MKLAIITTLLSTAIAFNPTFIGTSKGTSKAVTSLNMNRREMLTSAALALPATLVLPNIALADGSVSAATKNRARGIYGNRIASLGSAVASGDFGAIVAEKNAFILYNSGVFANDKGKQSEAIAATNQIFAAIRSQDKAGLKKAYDAYCKEFDVAPLPDLVGSKSASQGYSTDYDYRVRTNAATIYVR
mmetsp:Transcript_5974/g.12396  ORF Transcript_5974/g.12396 Transcript_5974/m.12396 type:complete len:188 (+) Transcript_5974:68-631(+)